MAELGYWNRTVISVAIAGSVIATVFYVLRLYSRRFTSGKLDVGDLFMGLGLLSTYGFLACVLITVFNGLGKDAQDLPQSSSSRATFAFWLEQKFWATGQILIKLSIIMLLRQTLGTIARVRAITTVLIVYTLAWGATAIFAHIFQCWPVERYWKRHIKGHCIRHQVALFMSTAGLSLGEDVALLLLPLVVVWRLKLVLQQKIQLTLLFSVGTLVCVFSLMRLVELKHYDPTNFTRSGSLETLYTTLEINLAIICASVVLMRPLLHRFFKWCPLSEQVRRKVCTSSTKSSNFMHFFHKEWPYADQNFSQNSHTEIRSEVCRVPSAEWAGYLFRRPSRDIMVQTSIDQDIHNREAFLAALEGSNSREAGISNLPSSRLDSIGSTGEHRFS
ncbi:uncharacterized protein BDW47DRAFT_100645 [Aspergillus candidus]|uniref:Rhodopsin domain-containing protein n=1 Tax=Aspergillus candidus TaxID=41067 RepID=A0A2I2FJ80_ASPCN|nr:hypothetical protein BDW47DRAFT_100645 [Aspergillus candidus]PLB40681.1 hypothetical protein BDW47DRAFT_100645 [Aspergillus candidus]